MTSTTTSETVSGTHPILTENFSTIRWVRYGLDGSSSPSPTASSLRRSSGGEMWESTAALFLPRKLRSTLLRSKSFTELHLHAGRDCGAPTEGTEPRLRRATKRSRPSGVTVALQRRAQIAK